MSGGPPLRLLAPHIGQRDVELEVRNCVRGAISPLLANIYLHAFDRAWAESGTGTLVRYADDFVVLCSTRSQAEDAHRRAIALMGELGLELHPDKT
ncbi:MAG: reverse transcriptase domain-containing protein, partial [bacterium]